MNRPQHLISDHELPPLQMLIIFSRMCLFLYPWAILGITLDMLDVDLLNAFAFFLCKLILLSGLLSLFDTYLPSSFRPLRGSTRARSIS